MARGNNRLSESVAPSQPPLPTRVVVKTDTANIPNGVHDNQMKAYGFNDLTPYQRPDHYVRYIEPLDMDLGQQVEYDMDEQDEEWLLTVNAERKQQQINTVSYEVFEILMDRLEKEYFQVSKHLPKADLEMPNEDSPCAICDDSEGENSNVIVFCDGCNLAVHQECYGVPYIPEGQWLCRKCKLSPAQPVDCALCPESFGAFKQTAAGVWVHVLCVLWVPGCVVDNLGTMEPCHITDIDPKRWKLKCCICGRSGKDVGACIQCRKSSCSLAYHVTCARKWKLLLPMKGGNELVSYCHLHLPAEHREAHLQAREAAEAESENPVANSTKMARAYGKEYKSSPPVVPWIIVERIMQYIGRVGIRKKQEFVIAVCKYWSLKREHRRGAPLLKRLHNEAWPAGSSSLDSMELQKGKLEELKDLLQRLLFAKRIAELVRQRESRKLRQTHIVQNAITSAIFAHEPVLRATFQRISGMDKVHHYFQNPVSKRDVPDYFDIIKKPMCWKFIQEKLDRHEYWDVKAFKDDINLVVENAKKYNGDGTPHYKTAERIQAQLPTHFLALDSLCVGTSPNVPTTNSADGLDVISSQVQLPDVGDLEPPIEILEMLYSSEPVQDCIKYAIDENVITSLFEFSEGHIKSPPTPPPPPPPPPPPAPAPLVAQPKRDRRSKSKSHKKKEKERPAEPSVLPQQQQEQLDAAPGFRAPRKRARSLTTNDESQGQTPWAGQASVPKFSNDVDKQDHFKYFDAGWVLPDGAKRNRGSTSGPSTSQVTATPATKKRKASVKKPAPTLRKTTSEIRDTSSAVPDTPMGYELDGQFARGSSQAASLHPADVEMMNESRASHQRELSTYSDVSLHRSVSPPANSSQYPELQSPVLRASMSSSPGGIPERPMQDLTPLDDLTSDVEMDEPMEFMAGRYSAPISQERLSHSVDPLTDATFAEERWAAEDYSFQRWPRDSHSVPAETGSSPDRSAAGQTRTASLVPLPSCENFQSPSGSEFSPDTSLLEPLELADIHTPFMLDSHTPEAAVDASQDEPGSSAHVIADASTSMELGAVEAPAEALPKSPIPTETTAPNGDVEMAEAAIDDAPAASEPPVEPELKIDVIPPTDSEPNADSTPPIGVETKKESTITAEPELSTPSIDAEVNKQAIPTTESEQLSAELDANTSVVHPEQGDADMHSAIHPEQSDSAMDTKEAAEPSTDVTPTIDSEPKAGDNAPAEPEAKADDSTPAEPEVEDDHAPVEAESKVASPPAVEAPQRDPSITPNDSTPAPDTVPSEDPSTSVVRAESSVSADPLPFNESATADASGEEDDEEEENELTIEEVRLKNPGKLVRQDTNGTFIIEEIVTPESRRAKALAALEKRKAKAAAAPQESDSKSLGTYPEGEVLESGTLVWAKITSFPWYPAVVYDDDIEGVPADAVKLYQRNTKARHIVRFYDEKKTWAVVALKNLKPMCDIQELDDDMLSDRSKLQPKKQWTTKQKDVKKAYAMAMEEREKEGENAESGVNGDAEEAPPPEADGMDEDAEAEVLPVKPAKKKPGRKSRAAVADDEAMQVDEPATKKKRGRKPRVTSADAMEVDAVESSTNGRAKAATKKGKRKAAPSSPAAESDGEPEVDTPEDDGRPVRKKQKVAKLLDP